MIINKKLLAFCGTAAMLVGCVVKNQKSVVGNDVLTEFPVTHEVKYTDGSSAYFSKMPTTEAAGIVASSNAGIENFIDNHSEQDSMFLQVSRQGHIIDHRDSNGNIVEQSDVYSKEAILKTGKVKNMIDLSQYQSKPKKHIP